jgi:hypothetical protein
MVTVLVLVIIYNLLVNRQELFQTNQLNDSSVFQLNKNTSALNCYDLANELGASLSDLTDDEATDLKRMYNNTYRKTNDSNSLWGKNECIIPVSDTIQLPNCNLNGIQLQKDNPELPNVTWTNQYGCVISEDDVKNNISNIAKQFHYIRNLQFLESANATTAAIESNNNITTQHYNNVDANNKKITYNNEEAYKAVEQAANSTEQTRIQKDIAITNVNKKNAYNIETAEIEDFMKFIKDKVVGIRYSLYVYYFADSQKGINTIKNSEWLPFESGVTDRIDNFAGMNPYLINTRTEHVTSMFEFWFRPDVSTDPNDPNSAWEIFLESDDASYLWYDTTSWDMKDAAIKNPGIHGMSGNSLRLTNIKGTDQNPTMKGFFIRIIQGNNGGPGGIRFKIKRPNGTYFVPVNGQYNSSGSVTGENWRSKYMMFSDVRKGIQCKTYMGYFESYTRSAWYDYDDFGWFNVSRPMSTVSLNEIYNMDQNLLNRPDFGITKTKFFRDNPKMSWTNFWTYKKESTHYMGAGWWPFNFWGQRSIHCYGFFYPPVAGSYTFYLSSDDSSFFWLGDYAVDHWHPHTAYLKLPGLHHPQATKVSIMIPQDMVDTPVPIRIVQGDWGGWGTVVFGFSLPDSNQIIYDLTNYVRH